jgi:DNA polymerase-1
MSYLKKYLQTPQEETVLLIDGDLYLYRACAACETEIDWGDDIWSLSTDLKEAKTVFQKTIDDFCDTLGTGHFIVCLSDKGNFRKELDSTYKGGRKKVRKPVGYLEMLRWVKKTYRWHIEPMLEADDVMGILGSAPNHNTIVISDDKDLKSVPCKLFRPMSGEFQTINKAQADLWFYTQALTGDVTDGYAGCPSVGPKTAEKLLKQNPSWSTVVNAYAKQKLNANYALTQARLARILRYEDWDLDSNTIKLWEPRHETNAKKT